MENCCDTNKGGCGFLSNIFCGNNCIWIILIVIVVLCCCCNKGGSTPSCSEDCF